MCRHVSIHVQSCSSLDGIMILNECPCLPATTALRSLGSDRATRVLSEWMLVGLCNVRSDELMGEMSMESEDRAVGETSVASEFFLLPEEEDKRRDPDADCVRSHIFCLSAIIESSRLPIVSTVSTEGCLFLSSSLKHDGSLSAFSLSSSSPSVSLSRLVFLCRRIMMQPVRPKI